MFDFARVSYLEIYNESMFDLLGSLPEATMSHCKEPNSVSETIAVVENQDGIYVKGLSCYLAQNEEEALNLLFEVKIGTRVLLCEGLRPK